MKNLVELDERWLMLAKIRYLATLITIKVVPERDLVHSLNTQPEQSACLLRFAHNFVPRGL
jgi:hypothetical protein